MPHFTLPAVRLLSRVDNALSDWSLDSGLALVAIQICGTEDMWKLAITTFCTYDRFC